jgi:Tol biopolymer transport system component
MVKVKQYPGRQGDRNALPSVSRKGLSCLLTIAVLCLAGCLPAPTSGGTSGTAATVKATGQQAVIAPATFTATPASTALSPATPSASPTSAPRPTRTPLPAIVPTQTAVPTPTPEPTLTPTHTPIAKIASVPGSIVLYVHAGSLMSCPQRSLFEHPEMPRLYRPGMGERFELGMYLVGHAPVPSPDGRWLVITDLLPSGPDIQPGTSWLGDMRTGELTQLGRPAVAATWSPDGHRFTYVLDETLYIRDGTGDARPVAIFRRKGLRHDYARWSPTGKWIAVAGDANPEDRVSSDRMFTYWLVSPDDSAVVELGTWPTPARGAAPQDLDWSPDGRLLDTPSMVVLTVEGQSLDDTEVMENPPASVPARFTPWLVDGDKIPDKRQAWLSHQGGQIAYLGQDGLYVFDRGSRTDALVATYDVVDPVEVRWSVDDGALIVGARGEARSKGSAFWGTILALKPEAGSAPELLVEGEDVSLVDVIPDAASTATPPPTAVADRLPPGWVYRYGGALWLVDPGGWSRLVSRDPRAKLSPDGRQLITLHDHSKEYRLRDRVTGEYHHLAVTPGRLECCYRWWPERPGLLLFTSIPADMIGLGGTPSGTLSVVNVNGMGYQILDAAPITWSTAAAPSPDGQTLAYSEGKTGWLYRWGVGSEVFDLAERGLAEVRNAQLSSPAWSPEGTQLAWVVRGDFGDDVVSKSAIVAFDLSARTADVLFDYHQARKGFQQPAPVWSPDGRWLAFEAWSTVTDEDGMWVLPVDGSSKERTYLGPGSDPIWSPDGRWLVFTRVEGEEDRTYVHKVGGGGAIPFARMAGARLVDWIELAPGVQPVPTATPLPAIAQGDVVLPAPCLRALEGTSLYVNPIDGYCLRHPARFRVDDVYPPGIANLYGPPLDPHSLEPLAAGSALLVEGPAGDPTLSQAVDAWLERRGAGPPIRRDEGVLGGQPAELVEYQGSYTRVRVVFALYESRLYALSFYPDGEQFPRVAADVDALWETVTASFAFLPPDMRAALGGIEGLAQAQATRAALDELARARGALVKFLSLLHDGRYAEAVSYYGGDYQVLRDRNPTVPPNDYAWLLKNGCTVNGLQCFAVKAIVDEQEISPGEYVFTVEFAQGDPSARQPPAGQINFTVVKVEGEFLVQELPVYVP